MKEKRATRPRTCKEGKILKGASLKQSIFVSIHSIADLGVLGKVRSRAPECWGGVELRNRDGVTNPSEELLVRHDPDVGLSLGPIEKLIDHVDDSDRVLHTWISRCDVNRVGWQQKTKEESEEKGKDVRSRETCP